MKKFYVSSEEILNDEEKRTGRISYNRLVERIIGKGLVLCNNIEDIDSNINDNYNENIYDENDDFYEIYQYYLCDLNDWQRKEAEENGLILTYSDFLDLDVLCVEHFGTSWNYVMTDIEWTTNFDEV